MSGAPIKIVTAVVISGHIARPGDMVQVSAANAADLINRGVAVPYRAERAAPPKKPGVATPVRRAIASTPATMARTTVKAKDVTPS